MCCMGCKGMCTVRIVHRKTEKVVGIALQELYIDAVSVTLLRSSTLNSGFLKVSKQ